MQDANCFFMNVSKAKLTGNDVFVSVLLVVLLFLCSLGGVGLVGAVLIGQALQPLQNRKDV